MLPLNPPHTQTTPPTVIEEAHELGKIAAAACDVSGKELRNPFPAGTLLSRAWANGWNDEAEKINREKRIGPHP